MIDIENMTEEQGMDVVRNIFNKFGFVGTYFTRADVESYLERNLTDDEFDALCDTRAWRKGIEESMCEHGWDLISYALDEVGLDKSFEVE